MKVNFYNNNVTFKGFYNSKLLKRGLEFACDNGALFSAAITLALSTVVRPLSIMFTPKTDKENKKVACAKSIASSLIGYGMMLCVSKPVSRAIKNIDNNTENYLKSATIKNFQTGTESLIKSKSYAFATQIFKLGVGTVIAAPKAVLTALALPLLLDRANKTQQKKSKEPAFTGVNQRLTGTFAKIINNKKFQDFALKYQDSNFPMHIVAMTDALTTATFIGQIKNNKQILEERKKPLIYNATISTALSIGLGYIADKLLQKPTEKFIEKFKMVNKDYKHLDKCLQGIKIAKPVLILGIIYYMFIPVISTFFADRIAKTNNSVE